jgi:YVTN family beta-propeller protein
MRRFRSVLVVVVLGLAGALVGVVSGRVSAVPAPRRCRPTAFVVNGASGTVSTIDVKTRTKDPADISVGGGPLSGVEITPDGKTVFVNNPGAGVVSRLM